MTRSKITGCFRESAPTKRLRNRTYSYTYLMSLGLKWRRGKDSDSTECALDWHSMCCPAMEVSTPRPPTLLVHESRNFSAQNHASTPQIPMWSLTATNLRQIDSLEISQRLVLSHYVFVSMSSLFISVGLELFGVSWGPIGSGRR